VVKCFSAFFAHFHTKVRFSLDGQHLCRHILTHAVWSAECTILSKDKQWYTKFQCGTVQWHKLVERVSIYATERHEHNRPNE
jgi:hypothetical protein